jgi:hypothetical protein
MLAFALGMSSMALGAVQDCHRVGVAWALLLNKQHRVPPFKAPAAVTGQGVFLRALTAFYLHVLIVCY